MITLEIPAPEFVKRFQSGEIPTSAHVTVTYEPMAIDNTPMPTAPETVAAPESWDSASPLVGAELEAERQLFERFEESVNASRKAAGMRTL